MHEAGHGHDYRFQKVEPMLGEWAAHGHPTVLFGMVKISPGLCELDKKRPCVVCKELCEMNGLSWLIKEINRLMLDVLT